MIYEPIDIDALVSRIIDGDYDKYADNIKQAFKTRESIKGKTKLCSLVPGDRVRFINCRPKYLVGVKGTVVERRGDKLSIKPDENVGKFYGNITTPPDMIEKLSPADDKCM